MTCSLRFMLPRLQTEEQESVPARAGDVLGNAAQRSEVPTLVFEAVRQHSYGDLPAGVLPPQNRAGKRQPWITTRMLRERAPLATRFGRGQPGSALIGKGASALARFLR